MLQLSGSLIGQPVLSLRAGAEVARTIAPILNPNNLKIEGFYCESIEREELVLLYQDIRDLIPQGFIVNDLDVLIEPSELVRLKDVMDIKFDLVGKQVITTSKEKVGKVADYAAETTTMFIQKLYVSQSLLKNLTGNNLSIDRTHIVEINDHQVIVHDILQPARVPAGARATA